MPASPDLEKKTGDKKPFEERRKGTDQDAQAVGRGVRGSGRFCELVAGKEKNDGGRRMFPRSTQTQRE